MKFENHDHYNIAVTLDDGSVYKMYADFLHNEQLDTWQGWHCEAGTNRVYIDADLDVWSGECKNDYLGNDLAQWMLLENHTVCTRNTCTGCTDDLAIRKWKPSHPLEPT